MFEHWLTRHGISNRTLSLAALVASAFVAVAVLLHAWDRGHWRVAAV